MAHGTPQEVAQKWLSRIQQSTADMQAGVARVTQAPGQAAVAKRQKWINSLADPATQDKWAHNTGRVSLQEWQQAMESYGISRVAQGAQAKMAKFEAAMGPLLQYIDQGRARVRQMDDSTFEARLARAQAMARWMHSYRRGG